MSVNEHDPGGPIVRASSLGRALDAYGVPSLSAGFANRVVASAEARPAPLPPLRRTRRRWRLGRTFAIGVVSFGALATAATATGLLQQFDIPVPSAETVWARIAGEAPAAANAPVPALASGATEPTAVAKVAIVGPIDTPEELREAFRRIDEVRKGRLAVRNERIGQRIDSAIERRRTAGLPVPTAEQETALRERIAAAEARRQDVAEARIAARREALQRKIDNGQALTREDIGQPWREDARSLRRREALRRLPPEERRAWREAYRARNGAAIAAPVPAPPAAVLEALPDPSPDPNGRLP
ncbi:MAG: hypothetical protein GW858_00370 [Sphingomonadales bacterium]|nr:hypothetical protein [Sphingomonadales bacterium]NCQ19830.1 hypothetical protein [Sphingomonadales bacterium]NCT02970.1 hypothetical protein [Sphingomonadales bacterium]